MPRIGNIKVIDEVLNGNATFESDPQHNEMLGRADSFTVQVFVTNTGGTSPTITVTYQGSNDGKSWITKQTVLSSVNIATAPYESMTDSTVNLVNGAQGKFQISLGGTNPYAYVRVVVCLRTE